MNQDSSQRQQHPKPFRALGVLETLAVKVKRLPIIRHIRWFYKHTCFVWWWKKTGRLYWLIPNPRDLDYLDAIWRGDA